MHVVIIIKTQYTHKIAALQKFYRHLNIEYTFSHLLDYFQPDSISFDGGWKAEVTAD